MSSSNSSNNASEQSQIRRSCPPNAIGFHQACVTGAFLYPGPMDTGNVKFSPSSPLQTIQYYNIYQQSGNFVRAEIYAVAQKDDCKAIKLQNLIGVWNQTNAGWTLIMSLSSTQENYRYGIFEMTPIRVNAQNQVCQWNILFLQQNPDPQTYQQESQFPSGGEYGVGNRVRCIPPQIVDLTQDLSLIIDVETTQDDLPSELTNAKVIPGTTNAYLNPLHPPNLQGGIFRSIGQLVNKDPTKGDVCNPENAGAFFHVYEQNNRLVRMNEYKYNSKLLHEDNWLKTCSLSGVWKKMYGPNMSFCGWQLVQSSDALDGSVSVSVASAGLRLLTPTSYDCNGNVIAATLINAIWSNNNFGDDNVEVGYYSWCRVQCIPRNVLLKATGNDSCSLPLGPQSFSNKGDGQKPLCCTTNPRLSLDPNCAPTFDGDYSFTTITAGVSLSEIGPCAYSALLPHETYGFYKFSEQNQNLVQSERYVVDLDFSLSTVVYSCTSYGVWQRLTDSNGCFAGWVLRNGTSTFIPTCIVDNKVTSFEVINSATGVSFSTGAAVDVIPEVILNEAQAQKANCRIFTQGTASSCCDPSSWKK